MNLTMLVEKLEEKVKQIFNDKECGNIFRIKGFMQTKPDQWIELNATHQNITIQSIKKGQEIFIVIGEKLNKEKITTNLMGTQTHRNLGKTSPKFLWSEFHSAKS